MDDDAPTRTDARPIAPGLWQRWRDHPERTREALSRIEHALSAAAVAQHEASALGEQGLAALQQALEGRIDALRAEQAGQAAALAQLLGRLDAADARAHDAHQQLLQQSRSAELQLARRLDAAAGALQAGLEALARRAAQLAPPADTPPLPMALDCRVEPGLPPRALIDSLARQLAGTEEARRLARR